MKRIGMLVLSSLILWASLCFTSCVQRIETNDRQPSESQSSDPATRAPGLYRPGTGELVYSWDEIVYERYMIGPTGEPNDELKWMIAGDLYLPHGIEWIGYEWYRDCNQLTGIVLPDSVTYLDSSCFEHCEKLQYVELGEGITSIAKYAFIECESLKTVVMSNAVTEIKDQAFSGCYSLEDITWPAALTTIGDYAFAACWCLREIPSLEKLESIGAYAFYGCKSLTTVHRLPALKETGVLPFDQCTALKEVHCTSTIPVCFYYSKGCTFYVPCGEEELRFEGEDGYSWSEFREQNTFVYHHAD